MIPLLIVFASLVMSPLLMINLSSTLPPPHILSHRVTLFSIFLLFLLQLQSHVLHLLHLPPCHQFPLLLHILSTIVVTPSLRLSLLFLLLLTLRLVPLRFLLMIHSQSHRGMLYVIVQPFLLLIDMVILLLELSKILVLIRRQQLFLSGNQQCLRSLQPQSTPGLGSLFPYLLRLYLSLASEFIRSTPSPMVQQTAIRHVRFLMVFSRLKVVIMMRHSLPWLI